MPCLDLGFFTLSSSPHATLGALSGICFCCWLRPALLLLLVLGPGKAAEIPPSASLLVSPHLCLSFSSQGSNTRCFPLSASSRCVLPGPEPSSSKEEAPFFFFTLATLPGPWLLAGPEVHHCQEMGHKGLGRSFGPLHCGRAQPEDAGCCMCSGLCLSKQERGSWKEVQGAFRSDQ